MSDSADKKYEEEEKVDAGDIELENVVNTERALVDDEDQDQDGKEKQVDQEAFTSKRLQVLPVDEQEVLDAKEAVDALHDKKLGMSVQQKIAAREKVDYVELMHHIELNHPTYELEIKEEDVENKDNAEPFLAFKRFPLLANLGSLELPFGCNCNKKSLEPTPLSQQLGVGPTLFLMTTKTLAWFFLVLTIFNLPVMMFFGSGNASGEFNKLTDLFAILSMGNIGQSDYSCSSVQVADLYQAKRSNFGGNNITEYASRYKEATNLNINCGMGSKIGSLLYVGLSKNSQTSCKEILKKPADYQSQFKSSCYYKDIKNNSLFEYDSVKTVKEKLKMKIENIPADLVPDTLQDEVKCFKNLKQGSSLDFVENWFNCHCFNRTSCTIPALTQASQVGNDNTYDTYNSKSGGKFLYYDRPSWIGYRIRDPCFKTLAKESEQQSFTKPQIIVLASCLSAEIENPFSDEKYTKSELGVLVVFFDIFTVLIMLFFTGVLTDAQEKYAESFDLATVQITDFTIRVKKLPHHKYYGDRDDVLRATLTMHFQELIKEEVKAKREKEQKRKEIERQLQESMGESRQDLEVDDEQKDDLDVEEIDNKDTDNLKSYDYEVADICFGKGDTSQMELLSKLGKLQNQHTRNHIRKQMTENDKIIKRIEQDDAKLDKQFIKLRDKYNETRDFGFKKSETNLRKIHAEDDDPTVRYAYVTFRSMAASKIVRDAYSKYDSCTVFCIMKCIPKKYCVKQREDIKKKSIFKIYPEITRACTPDNINWVNLGASKNYRKAMVCLNNCFALALIIAALLFIILLKQETIKLKKEFNTNVVCPQDSASDSFKEIAWQDQQLNSTERVGLMHCYCKQSIMADTSAIDTTFTEFSVDTRTKDGKIVVKVADKSTYCNDWFFNYAAQNAAVVLTSLVIVVINIIASSILTLSVALEKSHTINDETMGQFKKLTVLQFVNIGVVILIINFNMVEKNEDGSDGLFLGMLPIFNGQYDDFTSEWYSQIGKTLCLTMLINIFSPHTSKLTLPFVKLLKRWYDRGWSRKIWRQKNDDDDVDVNTKQVIQSDLNDLYTGEQIQSHFVYAQNYSYLWVVLMYSSGLPILYPFACIFFFILYWVYKGLLLKYYARTTKFNEDIPIESVSYIKFGIFLHIFIGSIMLSNNSFYQSQNDAGDIEQFVEGDEDYYFFINAYLNRMAAGDQGSLYLSFIVLLVIYIIFKHCLLETLLNTFTCLLKPFFKCMKCFKGKCGGKRQVYCLRSKDIFKEYNALALNHMYVKAKEDLDDFIDDIEHGNSVQYSADRYGEEVTFTAEQIKEIFERRVAQIELTIDDHLVHLHGPDSLKTFDDNDLSYKAKLRYLLEKQGFVDKQAGERMRMVDITQSFNIYDSQAHQATKLVEELIEENPYYSLLGLDKREVENEDADDHLQLEESISKAKLEYFEGHGRGLPIRMILWYTGVDYEDDRVNEEEFQKRKAQGLYKFGQLPVVTVTMIKDQSQRQMAQTQAILRFLAQNKKGQNGEVLYPRKDCEECYEIDRLVEQSDDIFNKYVNLLSDSDIDENFPDFIENIWPAFLETLEDQFMANAKNSKEHLVGANMSLADICMGAHILKLCYNESFSKSEECRDELKNHSLTQRWVEETILATFSTWMETQPPSSL